jgi:hypothetical protein
VKSNKFRWPAPSFIAIAGAVALGATAIPFFAACNLPAGPRQATLLELPAPTRAATRTLIVPETELTAVVLLDITTSAERYAEEAKSAVAGRLAAWFSPGRGGLDLHISRIASNSYDASNEIFSIAIQGLPEEPSLRPTLARPPAPDVQTCKANVFGRAACEAALTESHNAALQEAVADEDTAANEFEQARALFEQVRTQRLAEVAEVSEQIKLLDLVRDDRGTDLDGALLRAAEILQAARAPQKLLIVQSDMLPSGRQTPGELNLKVVNVLVIFYDCREGDCAGRKAAWTERFIAAGAASVAWHDPASSRLLSDLFEAVRR